MKSPAVPLTPDQQKLAADYHKFASITAARFKHKAPYDELLSACHLRLVLCCQQYRPDNVTGADFKTYLIRSLRWACSKVVTDRRDQVQACQLSIDVTTEDASRTDSFDLHDMIDEYATDNEAGAIRSYLQTGKLDTAARRQGVTKERIRQLKERFVERCRDHLGLTRFTLGSRRPALMEVA